MARTNTPKPPLTDLTAPGEWMTVEEVCELLDVARSTLDGWRKRDDSPFPAPKRLPNRSILYRRAQVAAWLDGLLEAA